MCEDCCPSILNILRWQQQLTVWICVLNLCFESGNDLSVHVVDFQVYIFCEMSLQIYCHFLFIGLFLFSLLNFKSSLCVWVTCFIRYDFYKYLLLVWGLLVIFNATSSFDFKKLLLLLCKCMHIHDVWEKICIPQWLWISEDNLVGSFPGITLRLPGLHCLPGRF